MQQIIDFVWNNWQVIVPVVILVISEILPFVKSTDANSVLQVILNILKKLNPTKV